MPLTARQCGPTPVSLSRREILTLKGGEKKAAVSYGEKKRGRLSPRLMKRETKGNFKENVLVTAKRRERGEKASKILKKKGGMQSGITKALGRNIDVLGVKERREVAKVGMTYIIRQ